MRNTKRENLKKKVAKKRTATSKKRIIKQTILENPIRAYVHGEFITVTTKEELLKILDE